MQRVAIARALVNRPEILLADEPTGALDTETGIQVMEILGELARDHLVIMVTHNPELADRYASRIIRLKDGRVTDDSDPFEGEADESGLTEVLYGTVGTAPYGLAEYGDGTEMTLRYVTQTLGGPDVEMILRYHDTVLSEILLHTLESEE